MLKGKGWIQVKIPQSGQCKRVAMVLVVSLAFSEAFSLIATEREKYIIIQQL